jgi:hypothetical protein
MSEFLNEDEIIVIIGNEIKGFHNILSIKRTNDID